MPATSGILFLNPRAGSLSAADEVELRKHAEAEGLRVVDVSPGLDVGQVVRDGLASRLRTFVVAGGDGSIHHVAQALVGTEGILGVIPIGTVNHAARDLDIPLDWREAMKVALRGRVR